MSREAILGRIRGGLGRAPESGVTDVPAARLRIPETDIAARIASFKAALEALAGAVTVAGSAQAACEEVARLLAGREAVASNAVFLRECGIADIAGVRTGIVDRAELKNACAAAPVGITSADYALADTGSLVMIASPEEARLVSLLPPVHIAVVPRERLLSGLDELFTLIPRPADGASSMVFITGPSRTADIEQILVRGVHGPGVIDVVIV